MHTCQPQRRHDYQVGRLLQRNRLQPPTNQPPSIASSLFTFADVSFKPDPATCTHIWSMLILVNQRQNHITQTEPHTEQCQDTVKAPMLASNAPVRSTTRAAQHLRRGTAHHDAPSGSRRQTLAGCQAVWSQHQWPAKASTRHALASHMHPTVRCVQHAPPPSTSSSGTCPSHGKHANAPTKCYLHHHAHALWD